MINELVPTRYQMQELANEMDSVTALYTQFHTGVTTKSIQESKGSAITPAEKEAFEAVIGTTRNTVIADFGKVRVLLLLIFCFQFPEFLKSKTHFTCL